SEEEDECDPHLARRDRPDHDRHQQDAAERNEIWNAQICAPARPARLAVTIGRRTCGHARISIAAIKPLHRRGFPSTEAPEQTKGAPWRRQASLTPRPASTSTPATGSWSRSSARPRVWVPPSPIADASIFDRGAHGQKARRRPDPPARPPYGGPRPGG